MAETATDEVTAEDWDLIRMALELVPTPQDGPGYKADLNLDQQFSDLYDKLRRTGKF